MNLHGLAPPSSRILPRNRCLFGFLGWDSRYTIQLRLSPRVYSYVTFTSFTDLFRLLEFIQNINSAAPPLCQVRAAIVSCSFSVLAMKMTFCALTLKDVSSYYGRFFFFCFSALCIERSNLNSFRI